MAKKIDLRNITAELDEVATIVQSKGMTKTAAKLDLVSNTLEQWVRTASDPDKAPEGSPPGTQATVQVADQFDAVRGRDYGPTPIGADSMGEALGMKSVADILNRLDLAQYKASDDQQEVHVQASKKTAKAKKKFAAPADWPFEDLSPEQLGRFAAQGRWELVSRAANLAIRNADSSLDANDDGMDEGDENDLYSTGGLPSSGGEDLIGDSDVGPDQKGVLPVYDKTPAGTGDGPGHHGPSASRRAEAILKAAAGRKADEKVKPDVFSPDDHFGEDKKPVEEAHSLGGKGKGAEASTKVAGVTVVRPKSIPPYLSAVWTGAIEYTNSKGRLLNASGKVDYPTLMKNYSRVLAAHLSSVKLASEDEKDEDDKDDKDDKGDKKDDKKDNFFEKKD